jgi:hypothetical protein
MASPLKDISQIHAIVASIDPETRERLEVLAYWPKPYSVKAGKLVGKEPRLSHEQYNAFYNSKVCFYN